MQAVDEQQQLFEIQLWASGKSQTQAAAFTPAEVTWISPGISVTPQTSLTREQKQRGGRAPPLSTCSHAPGAKAAVHTSAASSAALAETQEHLGDAC